MSYALLKNGGIGTMGGTRVDLVAGSVKPNFIYSGSIGGISYEYANRIVNGNMPPAKRWWTRSRIHAGQNGWSN